MKVYTSDKIRNVVLLGHGGAGKTSLAEAMAYLSGITSRMGKVSDGNTVSDFDKEEQKCQFSISTSCIAMEWDNHKINVLDAPGFFDFVGEVQEAMSVADAAIIVVSGKAGVEVGTERAWDMCEKYGIPRMFFVSDMDIDDASYRQVVQDLTDKYGKKIAPFNLPIRENEKFVGYVNVIQEKGFRWEGRKLWNVRFRITIRNICSSIGILLWRQLLRPVKSLWTDTLAVRPFLNRRSDLLLEIMCAMDQ